MKCHFVSEVYLQSYMDMKLHNQQRYNRAEKGKHAVKSTVRNKNIDLLSILQYLQGVYHLDIPHSNLLHMIKIVFDVQLFHF